MSDNNSFSHLTLEERRIILTGITNGSTKTAIAQTIGKDKSTAAVPGGTAPLAPVTAALTGAVVTSTSTPIPRKMHSTITERHLSTPGRA